MHTPTKPNSAEQRRGPRIQIEEQVEVSDTNSGRTLGQLVNLSSEGLMLVGANCVAPGTVYQLSVPLNSSAKVEPLLIGAESLWCSDANDSGFYWTGFQIIDISPEHRAVLQRIVLG
jgi:hypothetical protein